MTLEMTIQASFDLFPDLFQHREQVLDNLFCTIGNGYDWIDGELVEVCSDLDPVNPLGPDGKAKQYKVLTVREHRLDMRQFLIDTYNTTQDHWKQRLDELLEPTDRDDEPEYPTTFSSPIYPLCRRFSYMFNYPEDIKPDWLDGINEMYEILIKYMDDEKITKATLPNGKIVAETFQEVSKEEFIELYEDFKEKHGYNS
jgi:hypothetical protein